MTDPLKLHPPSTLINTFCHTILHDIHPLSKPALSNSGTKLFGAAIYHKKDLSLIIANTNQESASPLFHGETYTMAKFFELPNDQRPDPKDCIFLSTHEPCSMCINCIAWGGFDNFVYMWTYEETDELFAIPGDLMFWRECFYDDGKRESEGGPRQATLDGRVEQRRPEYRLQNSVFVARSFNELLAAVDDESEKMKCHAKVQRTKMVYGSLNETFRKHFGIDKALEPDQ